MGNIKQAENWLDKQKYPFQHREIQLAAGKMHYIDEGQGEVILFVHGTPTWSFLYRNFIAALSEGYRCIAVDHLGFGLSEMPQGFSGRVPEHAENLGEFILKMDLRNITLVVHDFGGPIGLGAALKSPERIKQVVLFNSWLWETASNPSVEKVDKIIRSALGRFLYLRMNFSPKILLKKGFADKKRLSKEVHRQYIRPFPDKQSRYSLLRIAESLRGDSDWYQSQWEALGPLLGKEWLVLWGTRDGFITVDFLEKWRNRLGKAEFRSFDCGHFVQEERGEEAIAAIREFMAG